MGQDFHPLLYEWVKICIHYAIWMGRIFFMYRYMNGGVFQIPAAPLYLIWTEVTPRALVLENNMNLSSTAVEAFRFQFCTENYPESQYFNVYLLLSHKWIYMQIRRKTWFQKFFIKYAPIKMSRTYFVIKPFNFLCFTNKRNT